VCYGENNGLITATASGGTDGYSLTWSGGTFTMTDGNFSIYNLTSGYYGFTVTDSRGCVGSALQC
jgi:hypothetical protein